MNNDILSTVERRYASISEYPASIDCEYVIYRGHVVLLCCWLWGEDMTEIFDERELRLLASQCPANEVRYKC